MKMTKFALIFNRPVQIVLGLALSATLASAQQVSLDITADPRRGNDWFGGINAEYETGPNAGSTYMGGIVTLLCFNRLASNPVVGNSHLYEIKVASDLYNQPGALTGSGKGEALLHWFLDTYYYNNNYTVAGFSTGAVQNAIWEIAHDYDGNVSSLDGFSGINSASPGRTDLTAGVDALIANYDFIPSNYRSSHYNVGYLDDLTVRPGGGTYQDMLVITAIPESSSAILAGLAGMAALTRRKRSA